jgi:hypothetical protein
MSRHGGLARPAPAPHWGHVLVDGGASDPTARVLPMAETQALLDTLVESLPRARLLVLVTYRPEYQHGWGSKTYLLHAGAPAWHAPRGPVLGPALCISNSYVLCFTRPALSALAH